MLRFVKKLGWLAALACGLQPAFGFSLLGPVPVTPSGDVWQIPAIGYDLSDDIGTPKNLGEEYRWNTPYIYYAFDQNFTDYFGSNGVWAVEQAIATLNSVKPVSQYSANLAEVPLRTRMINYRAQALHLYDLKSTALYLTLEELGLTKPDQYVWTLRSRVNQPGLSCPYMIYTVIMRNFDPVTWQPTSYINGNLLSYYIAEFCTGTPEAVTVPFFVDPQVPQNFPVMSFSSTIGYGYYTTRLTRDDVGGLRYIYGTNNINWEAMSSDSTMFYTNIAAGQQLLFTSNLTMLASQALTNNAGALAVLYPSLSIAATTNIYTNIWVTNLTAYLTNYPWEPYGTPPHTVYLTNRTLTVQTWYHHIFNNVLTPQFTNGAWRLVPLPDIVNHRGLAWITVETTFTTNYPSDPYGTPPRTNTTSTTYATNLVAGEYFIMPTNVCDITLASLQATLVTKTTNIVVSSTNITGTATNTGSQILTQSVIDYFTNHVFTYYEVDCVTTNVMLRKGIDKFTFLRANYDSLVGRFFQPITNLYYLVGVTNSHAVTNWFRRIVNRPDYLYTAQDLLGTLALRTTTGNGNGNFNAANQNPGLAGPGNIEPNMTITFNKVGPILGNIYSTNFLENGLSQLTATTNFIWGTYDGSTNEPVIYPSGASIVNLEAQILFQIVTAFLPDGKVHTAYPTTQLQAAGGVLPYSSWTWANGWPALPPGLSLSSSGIISGTPTWPGTYGFTVSVTGGDSRTITRSLSITIKP
jgi:hypothetical protein